MNNLILKWRHSWGWHDWQFIESGNEKSGGMLFGGAYHWSKYRCSMCGTESKSATETF